MSNYICKLLPVMLVIILSTGCSVTPGGVACMQEATTAEGEAACAEMYQDDYTRCLNAGGNYREWDRKNDSGISCVIGDTDG